MPRHKPAIFFCVVLCVFVLKNANAETDPFAKVQLTCEPCGTQEYCTGGVSQQCPDNSLADEKSNEIGDCICINGFLREGDACNVGQAPKYYQGGVALSCVSFQKTIINQAGSGDDCVCSAGYKGTGQNIVLNCAPCGNNEYQNLQGELTCETCPTDSGHLGSAQTAVTSCLCNAGHTGPDGGTCTDCEAGKFKDTPGSAACEDCQAGTYSLAGQPSCTTCRTHSTSDPGSGEELDCECLAGYRYFEGKCAVCQAGKFSGVIENNGNCDECADGKFAYETTSTACIDCTDANAVSSSDKTRCVCKAGYFQSISDQLNRNYNANPDCTECAPGKYQINQESISCEDCPADSHSAAASDSMSKCFCKAGFYEFDAQLQTCEQCPEGTYKTSGSVQQDETGISACSTCPDFSTTENKESKAETDCQCNAGYTGPNGGTCLACSPGEYKTGLGPGNCQDCTGGNTYSDSAGSETCSTCPEHSFAPDGSDEISDCKCDHTNGYNINHVFDKDALEPCPLCPAGKKATEQGCVDCRNNEFSAEGAIICSSCPGNGITVSNEGDAICQCKQGYACSSTDTSDPPDGVICNCEACPADTYKDSIGSVGIGDPTGCQSCPLNTHSATGSDDVSDCGCNGGYESSEALFGVECSECAAGKYAAPRDQVCTDCSTLDTNKNYYTPLLKQDGTSNTPRSSSAACVECSVCPSGQYDNARSGAGCGELEQTFCHSCPPDTDSIDTVAENYRIGEESCACVAHKFGSLGGTCSNCPLNTKRPLGAAAGQDTTAEDCLCAEGHFPDSDSICQPCLAGYYKDEIENTTCTKCADTFTTQSTGSTDSSACVCEPGEFLDSTVCADCAIGDFQTTYSTPSQCQECRQFSTSDARSDEEIDCKCLVGYGFKTVDSVNLCEICVLGQNKSAQDNTACGPCPVNHYADSQGTADCSPCPGPSSTEQAQGQEKCICDAGYEGFGSSTESCSACVAGKYRSDTTTSTCADCGTCGADQQVKEVCLTTQDIQCKDCQQYSNSQAGRTSKGVCDCNKGYELNAVTQKCDECSVGKANNFNADNTKMCTDCVEGKFAATTAKEICDDCTPKCASETQYVSAECTKTTDITCSNCLNECPQAGYYFDPVCGSQAGPAYAGANVLGRGQAVCKICPPGWYCEDKKTRKKCPDGTESLEGATSENDCGCNAGKYRPNPGEPCADCLENHYCLGKEDPALPCPENSETTDGEQQSTRAACHCKPGYYRASPDPSIPIDLTTFICKVCTPDDYCADNIRTDCPANMVADGGTPASGSEPSQPGSDHIQDCVCKNGYEASEFPTTTTTTCSPCEKDTFCVAGVKNPCPEGEWTNKADKQHICICEPGLYRSNDGTPEGNAAACQPCQAGHYCPGNTFKEVCTGDSSAPDGSSAPTDCLCNAGFESDTNSEGDHVCLACIRGSTYKEDPPGNSPCQPCETCPENTFVSDSCRTAHAIECQPCTVCDPDGTPKQYASTSCREGALSQDTVCSNCATCDYATHYQAQDCTATQDTTCNPISTGLQCTKGQYAGQHSQTTDAFCDACYVEGNLHDFVTYSGTTDQIFTYNDARSCRITCRGFSKLINTTETWRGCETCETGNALLKDFDSSLSHYTGLQTECLFTCKDGYALQGDNCLPVQTVTSPTETPALSLQITNIEPDALGNKFTVVHSKHSRFIIAIGQTAATNCKYNAGQANSGTCCFSHMTRISTLANLGLKSGAPEPCGMTSSPLSQQRQDDFTFKFVLPDDALDTIGTCTLSDDMQISTKTCEVWFSIVDTIAWRSVSQLLVVTMQRGVSFTYINLPMLLLPLQTALAQVIRVGTNQYLLVLQLQAAVRDSGADPVHTVTIRAPQFTFQTKDLMPECQSLSLDGTRLDTTQFSITTSAITSVVALFQTSASVTDFKAYLKLEAGTADGVEVMDVAVIRKIDTLPVVCSAQPTPAILDLGLTYAAVGLGRNAVLSIEMVSPDTPASMESQGHAGTLLTLVARATANYVTDIQLHHLVVVHLRGDLIDATKSNAYATVWESGTSPVYRTKGVLDLTHNFRVWCRDAAQRDAAGSMCQYQYLHFDPDVATKRVDCSSENGKITARQWLVDNFGVAKDTGHVQTLCTVLADTDSGNLHAATGVLVNTRAFMHKHEQWNNWQDWTYGAAGAAGPLYQTKVWSTFKYVE